MVLDDPWDDKRCGYVCRGMKLRELLVEPWADKKAN